MDPSLENTLPLFRDKLQRWGESWESYKEQAFSNLLWYFVF